MSDDMSPSPPAPPAPIKRLLKVGDPGQPTIEEWKAEIANDLRVAMGKMDLLPMQEQKLVARIKRAIEVHLAS